VGVFQATPRYIYVYIRFAAGNIVFCIQSKFMEFPTKYILNSKCFAIGYFFTYWQKKTDLPTTIARHVYAMKCNKRSFI